MAEAKFRCNICSDGKLYTSKETKEHKEKTGHNSWRMIKGNPKQIIGKKNGL